MARQTLRGTVVSKSGEKSVVVRVDRAKRHPLYSKTYVVSQKIMVHDEDNQSSVGDEVLIGTIRPMSKRKSWAILSKKESKEIKK